MHETLALLDFKRILFTVDVEIVQRARDEQDSVAGTTAFTDFLLSKKYFDEIPDELTIEDIFFERLFDNMFQEFSYSVLNKINGVSASTKKTYSDLMCRYIPLTINCAFQKKIMADYTFAKLQTKSDQASSGTEGVFLSEYTEAGHGTTKYAKESGSTSSSTSGSSNLEFDQSLCLEKIALEEEFLNALWEKV